MERKKQDVGALGLRPWVCVAPEGVHYMGLHENEASLWAIALGWPDQQEIDDKKVAGWYAAPATVYWHKPEQ